MYKADVAVDGEEALLLFERNKYNLIILDLMMSRVDGIEVCRRLRNKTNVPILMLTAKDHEVDKILGLSIGADDYITKPFSINEVIARVKAHMRRFLILGSVDSSHEKTLIKFKGLTMDLKNYTVMKDGKEISLTAKELQLLKFFVTHPGQVFTKTQLFRNVWDSNYLEDDNTVMVHIRKLHVQTIQSQAARRRIISSISHDSRTPPYLNYRIYRCSKR